MFTTFMVALLLLAAALLFLLAPRIAWSSYGGGRHHVPRSVGWVPLVIALVILAFACTAIVQAKNVGVLTSFGKPVGTKSPGLALKLPWQKLTEVDGTIQTDEYKGDSCIYVRIGDGSRSCVTLANRWEIVDERADVIYADFRSDDPTKSLRDAVVSTQLKAAAQEVLAGYNPIAELEVVEGSNASSASELSFAPDYSQLSRDILRVMEGRPGNELIDIHDITVSYVSLSDSTQKTIDDFIAEVGRTRNAAQAKSTAAEQAEANEILRESVDNSPGVLQARCLDSLAAAVEKGYQLPAGFSCFGGGGAVVVPSSK